MNPTKILYSDEEIYVINKPAGLAVQGGKGITHSLDIDFAKEVGQKVYLVHRLDKETCGLMIVAKNPLAAKKWTKLISSKQVKKEYFAMVADVIEQVNPKNKEELLAFINHEVELLEKKSAKSGQTKTQKENIAIMETISEVLADIGKPVTITEMMKDVRLSAYSNQKLSALVRKMPNVVKTTEKKKSYFSLVDTE